MRAPHAALPLLALALASCGDGGGPGGPSARMVHETTLNLQAPLANPDGINRVLFRWSTDATQGAIVMDHLESLVVELYAGATRVYADTVRFGGAYRPMGGATRAGLTWSYAFGPDILREVNNALIDQQNQSTGTQYIVSDNVTFQTDNTVALRRTVNGTLTYTVIETLASQSTVAVP